MSVARYVLIAHGQKSVIAILGIRSTVSAQYKLSHIQRDEVKTNKKLGKRLSVQIVTSKRALILQLYVLQECDYLLVDLCITKCDIEVDKEKSPCKTVSRKTQFHV